MFRPRNRIVLFRLTDEEYRCLRSACLANGARSLSDFARTEIMNSVAANAGKGRLEDRLRLVDLLLVDLQSAFQKVNRMLNTLARQRMGGSA